MKMLHPGWGTRKLINNPNIETDETDVNSNVDHDIPISWPESYCTQSI